MTGPEDPTEPIGLPPRPPTSEPATPAPGPATPAPEPATSAPGPAAPAPEPAAPAPAPEPAAPAPEPEAKTLPLPVIPGPALTAPTVTPATGQAVASPRPPRRRRRAAAWITTITVLVVLAVVAGAGWFLGNAWAEDRVIDQVSTQVRDALGLKSTAPVEVTVAEPMLPQLIAGRLNTLAVTVPDAPIGGATGTVTVHATDVPTGGDAPAAHVDASVRLSPDAIAALAGDIGRTVPGSLRIVGTNVAVKLDPSQFLSGVSFTLTLRPSASHGKLVLTPIAFEVAGGQVSADVIRARFGSLAAGILADRTVCVADRFPKGMTLAGIDVDSDAVVADFDVDPRILTDTSLQQPGHCG